MKIIKSKRGEYKNIKGMGEKSSNLIYDNIHSSLKNLTIEKAIGSSNILGDSIGYEKTVLLFKNIPDILDLYKSCSEVYIINEINKIKGFSEKTTLKIVKNLHLADKFISNLKPYCDSFKKSIENEDFLYDEKTKISTDLIDMNFVFTNYRNIEIENIIKLRGGSVKTSVSKKTNAIITNDINSNTTKIIKAKELGINIYNVEDFITRYNIKL